MAHKARVVKAGASSAGEMIGFRVEPAKAARAKRKAEREDLTLTQVLRFMLDEYLAGRFRVELRGGPVASAAATGEADTSSA